MDSWVKRVLLVAFTIAAFTSSTACLVRSTPHRHHHHRADPHDNRDHHKHKKPKKHKHRGHRH